LLHEVSALTSLFKDSTADDLTFLPVLVTLVREVLIFTENTEEHLVVLSRAVRPPHCALANAIERDAAIMGQMRERSASIARTDVQRHYASHRVSASRNPAARTHACFARAAGPQAV
jgi:hypothetical protein